MRFLIFALLFIPFSACGVVINEIAWMGTEEQWQNEWIELYSEGPVSLNGWTLKTEDNDLIIELKGTIDGYYLMERTDDTTVTDITADLIYKGGLNNQGEYLLLLDDENKIIDKVDCSLGWLAGDNETKRTMEKENDSWKTSSVTGGTPKKENSKKIINQQKLIQKTAKKNIFPAILLPGIALSLFVSVLAKKTYERTFPLGNDKA